MNIDCLDINFKLVKVIVFSFNDIQFQIDEIDGNVIYLKITYSTLYHLSLLHLFLVQHKQGKLGIKAKIIIIDDYQPGIEEKCILYNYQHDIQNEDQYWLNIATLSVQIGLKVKSITQEDEQIYKDTQNEIVVVSTKFPDFDIQELDNYFNDFIGKNKKKTPVKQLFERLKLPEGIGKFENTFLILLQHISMKIHQIVDYSHFLPMTLAYNAFCINQQISNLDDSEVNYQLLQCQQTYLSGSLSKEQIAEQQKINYFNLPLHLFYSFSFTQTKCIFQQMCDISYFFKAEFFCIYQYYNNLENAVVSQSSRSGKSVSILSVYYFNIMTKQKIPVYINLAYSTKVNNREDQPLYNHTSISVVNSVRIIGDFLDEGINYKSLFSFAATQSLSYQHAYSEVYQQIRDYFRSFDVEENSKLTFVLFENIKNQNQFQFLIENYNNLINAISSNKKQMTTQEKQENEKKQEQVNNYQQIIILVDEVLQLQKDKFDSLLSRVQQLTKFFSGELLNKVKYFSDFVYGKVKDSNKDEQMFIDNIQNILKLFGIETENSDENDLENIRQKVNEIVGDEERETYVYKYLSQQYFEDNVSLNQFIESICVTSPNFLNLKQYIKSCNLFYNQFKDFKKYFTKHVLDQCLFKYIMQLYNPRAIETIFWRNMYHDLQKTQQQDLLIKKTFNEELKNYIVVTDSFQKQYEFQSLNLSDFTKQYENPQTFNHGRVHLLSIGTDLAIINFISQNELLFTSPSSRSNGEYTQSHIIGGVQIHSSLLGNDYYQKSNISQASSEQLKNQINKRLITQDIQSFYLLQIPELASEIQFVCPLISPQIIIAGNTAGNNLITNSVNFYQYKVNEMTHTLQIIDSQTQIINSLKINRTDRFITLLSAQLEQDKTSNIYADQIPSNKFHLNLFVSTSMQFNQDIVFFFLYQASQNFKSYIGKNQDSNVTQQAEISRLYFEYQTITEITAIIQFLIVITQIDHFYFKQYLEDYQMKNFYLQLLILARDFDGKVKSTEFAQALRPIEILQENFKDAEFMFLQPCVDFITSIWGIQKQNRMKILMEHLYTILAKCYQSLIRLSCIQRLDHIISSSQSYKPFIIAVPIDKNKIYNKFEVNGSVADYLVAFFPGSQEIINDLSQHQFLKQQVQTINNEEIKFFTCIVESGIHVNEVLAEKTDINHNFIFYITPYVKNKTQLSAKYMELFVGKYEIKETQAENILMEDQKSFDKRQISQLVKTTEKVDKVFSNQKKIYVSFDTVYLKIYQQFFENLHFDKDRKEYYTYMKVQLQEYLDQKQSNFKVHVLKEQNYKEKEKGLFIILIDKTALIQEWASRQSNQNQLVFQNFLNNYLNFEIDFTQYEIFLTISIFLNEFKSLLTLLRKKLCHAASINICNFDFEIKMSTSNPNETEVIQFLNQHNLVILGCVKNIFYAYMFKSPKTIIQDWLDFHLNSHPIEDENYFKKFNSVILTEKIAKMTNLEFFAYNLTVKEQIAQMIKDITFQAKNGQINVEFFNIITEQTIPQTHMIQVENLTQGYILNLVRKYVIFKHVIYKDLNKVVFFVVDAEKRVSQSNSIVEEPVQKNIQPIKLSPLQTIKQWLASYSPKRSPEIENYLKLFTNLTEENVKNANLELFVQGMTVEEQIELMIEKARQEAQGAKIFLKFIDPVLEEIYPGTTTLVEPTVDDVIRNIGSFVFVEFYILKKTRVEITCIKVE